MQASGPVKEDTVIGPKIAAVERREARVPVTRRAAPQGADLRWCAFRRSAPLTHVRDKGNEGEPRADQTAGAMNHVCYAV